MSVDVWYHSSQEDGTKVQISITNTVYLKQYPYLKQKTMDGVCRMPGYQTVCGVVLKENIFAVYFNQDWMSQAKAFF